MMLPGKIENWVVISDFEKNGFGDISLGSIKNIMNVLTDNYRCRLGVNYVLNPAKSVYYIWTCVKPFLEDSVIEKVKISNKSYTEEIFTHCNPYQIEEKYGGKAPNLTKFWPPTLPDAPYDINELPRPRHQTESEVYSKPPLDGQMKRRSISANEKIVDPIEIDAIKNSNQYYQENIHTEDNQDIILQDNQYDDQDELRRQEKKKERKERREQKRLRKLSRERREKELEEIDKVPTNENDFVEDYKNKELCIKSNVDGLISVDVPLVDGDQGQIGCGMCSGFPSLPTNKCTIV